MKTERKKFIFYFDDDVDCTKDIISTLTENAEFEVTRATHSAEIEKERNTPFDLVIIDLMIHRFSLDENGQEVENIFYEGIPWQRTGLEFLRLIREGEYEKYGFTKGVKVIIASAVVDQGTKEDADKLVISRYIEKPFALEEIIKVIHEAFSN